LQQVNTSINLQKGIFRGLHLLRGKHSENKKITILMGEIIDFALNVDYNSVNYGKIYEYRLNQKSDSLLIPPLHAHGFLTISEVTVLAYQVDKPYVPHADAGVNIRGLGLDKRIVTEISKISDKDLALPKFERDCDMEFSQCKFC
jgi:dTDP-4-dehydrorhamnose 3,5-epimerase